LSELIHELDSNRIEFLECLKQLVSNLDQESKRHVGLLNAGEDLGLVDIPSGEQLLHFFLRVQLTIVDIRNPLHQDRGKRILVRHRFARGRLPVIGNTPHQIRDVIRMLLEQGGIAYVHADDLCRCEDQAKMLKVWRDIPLVTSMIPTFAS